MSLIEQNFLWKHGNFKQNPHGLIIHLIRKGYHNIII